MKGAGRALGAAFGYFSIFPVQRAALQPLPDGAALIALPAVGATIGVLSGLAAWLVSRVAPRPYAVATAFAAPIVLSGAIHLDGFLDCSDAIFATASPERRLEIMKDPRHGTYAIAAALVAGVFSLAALSTCKPSRLPATLMFSERLHVLQRSQTQVVCRTDRGLDALARSKRSLRAPRSAIEAGALYAFSQLSWISRIWPIVPVSFAVSALLARQVAARLGAVLTGDAYGFLIVVLEPSIVAFAAGLARDP